MRQVGSGVWMGGGAREVINHHPTPEEWREAAEALSAARWMLVRTRSLLANLKYVGRSNSPSEELEHVEHALTPLIAYLYEPQTRWTGYEEAKSSQLNAIRENPDSYVLEPCGIPQRGANPKCDGCFKIEQVREAKERLVETWFPALDCAPKSGR